MIKKKFFLLKFIFILSLVTSCFDYEEEITLNEDLSGKIMIRYTVPLKKDSNESFIAFLPSTQTKIKTQFKKKKSNLTVSNFKFVKIKNQNNLKEKFENLGKISYEVQFQQFSQLRDILLGKTEINMDENLIKVTRKFESVSLKKSRNKRSKGSEKIVRTIDKLLNQHNIKFKVNFPTNWICKANKGTVHLGKLMYNLPLKKSLKSDNLFWKYSLLMKY